MARVRQELVDAIERIAKKRLSRAESAARRAKAHKLCTATRKDGKACQARGVLDGLCTQHSYEQRGPRENWLNQSRARLGGD